MKKQKVERRPMVLAFFLAEQIMGAKVSAYAVHGIPKLILNDPIKYISERYCYTPTPGHPTKCQA